MDKWDTSHDGFLSKDEAAAVTSFDGWLFSNASMESFDEMQYFTNLTEIGEAAFFNCEKLTSITIPKTVTSIGNSAFQHCNLKSLIVLNPTPVPITSNTFSYYSYTTLYVPKGSKEAYSTAECWCKFSKIEEGIPGENNVPGDANGDGQVTAEDIMSIVNIISSSRYDAAADVNGDGKVDIADIIQIINSIMK